MNLDYKSDIQSGLLIILNKCGVRGSAKSTTISHLHCQQLLEKELLTTRYLRLYLSEKKFAINCDYRLLQWFNNIEEAN